jgi:hypothetical protein
MKDTSNLRRTSPLSLRERARVRSNLTKQQIEVTMFKTGSRILDELNALLSEVK